ncbi:FliH/SctL family protein [Cohnella sp. 56]|uniref:FliH/SctL family protein n=1 Tax=Cohnella sp. 56 TaxID=3113722 RepID=UPI0030E8FFD0
MSNLIKSTRVISLDELKQIELRAIFTNQHSRAIDGGNEGKTAIDVETVELKERIVQDAEETAAKILQEAAETARQIQDDAEAEATAWWDSRREADADYVEEAKRQGYEEGFAAGSEQAEQQTYARMEQMLEEARRVVLQAYEAKARIIAESEQFVVGLSCQIAGKIVRRSLDNAPELAVDLMKQALARRKEQGAITLCVAPEQFEFVEAARDELSLAVDAQAELQIVPDPSVQDGGCVIRSAYGSIDARIDTQLESIREELLQIAAQSREEGKDPHGA